MDNNIVSFIESIEPNLSYDGADGAMALLLECNENMLTIDNYISETDGYVYAYTEAEEKGLADKAKEFGAAAKSRAVKVWDWIITAIKNAIAKLKGLFFQAVKKAKILYAKAMNKIRELLNKAVSSHKGGRGKVSVEWYSVSATLKNYINAFDPAKLFEGDLKKAAGEKGDKDVALEENSSKITAAAYVAKALGGLNINSEDARQLTSLLKERCMTKHDSIEADQKTLESEFKNNHIDTLEKLYGRIMKTEEKLLKVVIDLRNAGKTAAATYANRVQSAVSGACTIFFNAVFGVVAKGLHQAIKATLYAIRKTITGSAGAAYDAVKDKFSSDKKEGKNESAEIELV